MISLLRLAALSGGGGGGGLPPVPTRDQVCRVRLTFQGLTVNTGQFGSLPWFEPAYVCLDDPADRAAVCRAKRAAGDTHLILECSSTANPVYSGEHTPYRDIPINIKKWDDDPTGFRALVEEVILEGLTPIVAFDGDEGDDLDYGDPNARRQLAWMAPLFASSRLGDLNQRILYARLWDGVFYGSSPENIASFGQLFRSILPDGYLGIEHNSGHIPVGGGAGDWANGGPMSTYDVLFSEFDYGPGQPANETIWQVACRLLGPAWRRPDDCPDYITTDYAERHWYLSDGTPRGRYFAIAFEWEGAYLWVRGQSTAEEEAACRAYLSACGYGDLTG